MTINPAWKSILDKLPDSLHSIVIPELEAWDKGVNKKLEDVRAEFGELEAYKVFADNQIDPGYIEQTLNLAQQIQDNPTDTINRINEVYKLGYVAPGEEQGSGSGTTDTSYDPDDDDITSHPFVKKLQQSLEEIQNRIESRESKEEEEQSIQEFQAHLDKLIEANPSLDPNILTAYMANGMSDQEAIEAHNQLLAKHLGNNSQTDGESQGPPSGGDSPPVVMGGNGGAGSGSPEEPINYGAMSSSDLTSHVENLLAQASNNNQ